MNAFRNKSFKHSILPINTIIWISIPVYLIIIASFINYAYEDELPSWNDGKNKTDIIEFVKRVTNKNHHDFIPIKDRIAVFDNDGTLWQEQPLAEAAFVTTQIKKMAAKDPTLKDKEPYKAVLEGDMEYLHKGGIKTITEILAITHANISQEEFESEVKEFLKKARHPKLNVPFTKLTYKPMLELISYLKKNDFQVWICSGGTISFIRQFSEESYGIPPQQVIGTYGKMEFTKRNGKWVLWREPELISVNNKNGKPVNIYQRIGKQPVFACGNVKSGGDLAMLTFSDMSKGPSFQMIINHDDDNREFAYQEVGDTSLNIAKKNNWAIVSMKDDWNEIFNSESAKK